MCSKRRRRAIGVLLNYISFFSEGIEGRLRRVLDAECARRDLDLYFIYGRSLEESDPSCAAYNSVFDLVHPARIDGVIIVSNLLAGNCSAERVHAFARRFEAFARCSVGMTIPDFPSLDIDNRPGMAALVEHLVVEHDYRRFAFMAGLAHHPHSLQRLEVCRNVLLRHGLELDPDLIVQGSFMTNTAEDAMDRLLSRRTDFDVVVSANDAMALGVIASLRKHGRSVPNDCAVTGFDDLIHARLGNPPLTTVAQPLELMALRALDAVEAQLRGEKPPDLDLVQGDVRVRDSCGCTSLVPLTKRAGRTSAAGQTTAADYLKTEWRRIQNQVERLLRVPGSAERDMSNQILYALESELVGSGPALVAVTKGLLNGTGNDPERFRAWHGVLEFLAAEFAEFAVPGLDGVWRDVQRELILALTASHLQQQLAMDLTYVHLLGNEDSVFGAVRGGGLQSSLLRHLPTVGIGTVSLSEYTEADSTVLRPVVHIVSGDGDAADFQPFPAYWLHPPETAPRRRTTFIVMPLVFESRPLGMSVLEYSRSPIPYHLLRDQISAALGTHRLQREIEHQSALRERSVQERLAATQRMESLSLLAGGVAHDLNNVLGPLVALPDVMLAQLESALTAATPLHQMRHIADIRGDIELIKVAGQRASQTIKDLLTLSRQGRAAKTPLDVNRVLLECCEEGVARELRMSGPHPEICLETASEPLIIMASEAHLVRAINNLLHNAIDATQQTGDVQVRSYAVDLAAPRDCYETIAPGQYVVLEISDTGCGLPPDTRQRIFEPFFTTKHLGQQSGTGLGLAIVHGVVKEHEGYIDVVSRPGQGTTFSLYFPRSWTAIPSVRPKAVRQSSGERILIVDDEPIQVRTCRRVLTRCGYRVESTNSGRDACQQFALIASGEAKGYDLVLLDVQLKGGEDGLEIYEKISGYVPNQKAVFASGHAPSHRIEAALKRGIPWLQKPYTADALVETVRAALDGTVG